MKQQEGGMVFKSVIRVLCLITIFCLAQALPISNYFRPREIINVVQIQSSDNDLQETIRKVVQSCVMIEVRGQYDYNHQPIKWLGSGVIVSENGIIITAGHMVKNATQIKVILNDCREYDTVDFEYEDVTDLGIIKIDANDLLITPIDKLNNKVLGDLVFTVGSPFGKVLFNTVTVGVISGLKRDIPFFGEKLLFQIDAGTAPGKSGGGVFNSQGNLIGIMVGTHCQYDSINLCIPANIKRYTLDKYCANKNLENVK